MKRMKIGIIGVGDISGIYLKNLTSVFSDRVELLGCTDLKPERARAATEKYKLPRIYHTTEELLADLDIELVVNLTIPAAHYEVCLAAVNANKHVYVEKPLCVKMDEAERLLKVAKEKGVIVSGAPDTVLGGGLQTCRKLLDDGVIGKPLGVAANMLLHGHEAWHPDPAQFYKVGGGPMFAMGPYYVTALVNFFGPVKNLTGIAGTTFPQRIVGSGPKKGEAIDVDAGVPTHVAGTLEFENGVLGTLVTSYDVWHSRMPWIEIYGTKGTLSVNDPNEFGGEILVRGENDEKWQTVPYSHGYTENNRGLGVAEVAQSIREGKIPRISSNLTHHVLEIMHGIIISAETGKQYKMTTKCVRPEPMPMIF
jgi:predicted dehydrogenase